MNAKISHEMRVAQLCKIMKWTYDEYLSNPADFNERILSVILREEKEKAKQVAELKNKGNEFRPGMKVNKHGSIRGKRQGHSYPGR